MAPLLAIAQLVTVIQQLEAMVLEVEKLRGRVERLEAKRREAYEEELVDTRIAARVLGFSPRTLEGWRRRGRGPAYISGRPVLYRRADLEAWQSARKVKR